MTNNQSKSTLSYRDAGVDIDAGNTFVEQIKPFVKKTHRTGVLNGLGGFGALFELPIQDYKAPILVSGTDGVGTKLKLALMLKKHDTIGIDLVAMCVNDIVVSGAEPLFFLDYYATGKLDLDIATEVVKGIAKGCEIAGCALTGGETAEMPGVYSGEDYDLAGFSVGIVEKSHLLTAQKVSEGDILLGLASSGPHSNGYSLIRKIIEQSDMDLNQNFCGTTLGEALLAPTRIYVKSLLALMQKIDLHALAHITGGGITENLPRVLPQGLDAQINLRSWPCPEVFGWLQNQGNIRPAEMLKTFNCGIGMMLCIAPSDVEQAIKILQNNGEIVYSVGKIIKAQDPINSQVIYPAYGE